jgi:SAM-dependent methyltransferase
MDNRQGNQEQAHAALYDAHHRKYLEDIPFWQELADRQADSLLELGCGTGRVSLALAISGKRVVALDYDRLMLNYLNQKRHQPANLYLFLADMAAFHLAASFSLILLPCNTLSTLSVEKQLATFQCVTRHLAPGGIFAASCPNPELLNRLPAYSAPEVEDEFPHPVDGEPVQVSSSWKRSKGNFHLTWHYDHLYPDGKMERTSVSVQHRLDSLDNYRDALSSAGLELIETYGDFDFSPYQPDSPNLILIAG